MAVKAADFQISLDTKDARAQWASLKDQVKTGAVDVEDALNQLAESFDLVNKAHRTGKKDVDAFSKLIKDEKAETRNLGFLMRNTAESVGTLSDAFGGPGGLGRTAGMAYAQIDQISFAFEAIGAAGSKAGGTVAKLTQGLASIALPAGAAIAAFGLLRNLVEEDAAQVALLTDRIRALDIELGKISTGDQLKQAREEVERIKREFAEKPDIDVAGWFLAIAEGFSSGAADFVAQHEERKRLEYETRLKEAQKRVKDLEGQAGGEGRAKVDAELALFDAMSRNIQAQMQLRYGNEETLALLERQKDIRDAEIDAFEGLLEEMRSAGFQTRELLDFETRITQEKIKQKDLAARIADRKAEEDVYNSPEYQNVVRQLKELQERYEALVRMENKNVPKWISQRVQGPEPIGALESLNRLSDEWRLVVDQSGNLMADSLSNGFMRGFDQGELMLKDFTQSMLQSLMQLAAQEASISIVSGLLSLIPGVGSFASVASSLGSRFFKAPGGGSGESVYPLPIGADVDSPLTRAAQSSTSTMQAAMRPVVSELRAVKDTIRRIQPTVYVGGVTTPDEIVGESLTKTERRRARRLK